MCIRVLFVCAQARVVLRPLRYDPFTGKGEGRWAAGIAEVRSNIIIEDIRLYTLCKTRL